MQRDERCWIDQSSSDPVGQEDGLHWSQSIAGYTHP
jgi:hypothetical protein